MKKIPLTRGKYTIVDDEDFERVNALKWFWDGRYANHSFWNKKDNYNMRMHRFILNLPRSKTKKHNIEVDHINGNRLDNRKVNLRICTSGQNKVNVGLRKTNTTGYKGVYITDHSKKNPYYVNVTINGKAKRLGCFPTKEKAAKAYDKYIHKRYKEFARLNFPQ